MNLLSYIIPGLLGLVSLYAVVMMVIQIVKAFANRSDQTENEPPDQESND